MTRPLALQELSTTHRAALELALKISEAKDERTIARLMESLPATFAHDIEPHLEAEERLLLPPLEAAGEFELVRHTRDEHQRLRELAARIAAGERACLNLFWIELHALVRFEERRLYEAAETLLPAELLERPLQAQRPH